ncbi:MAG TPA: LacI family DNA-binding transcriptional regulator [Prolixibacteraceae bacterium]|nr:LacI family DNA-binding transcriptional regulator [Prolixibacteraceae bacterium]HPS13275.1 LacI family DNA-binding transcriptional regulator [Prolixibacteraceae bacterium]
MVKKQSTIQDIARALNISVSTVSRALSDHPKISQATKDQVWNVAHELQYQVNTVASNLRKGKANTIGMIVPRINRHFFSNVITGVESVLNPLGYNLIICQSDEKLSREVENIKTLVSNRVGGIIISLSIETHDVKHLQKVLGSHVPLVLFDRISDQLHVSMVENDDVYGAYEMTRHLLQQGYRKIIWMGGPRNINIYRNRYNGYLKAMAEFGVDVSDQLCFEGTPTIQVAFDCARKILEKNNLPDAIFATSDYMAMGVIQACNEKGLRVPDDMAVAGYANEPFAELISPKLTTVEQFSEEIGKAAAQLLLEELDSENEEIIPKRMVLKPKLIIRESTIRNK